MIQVITIKNPFENRKEIRELYWTGKALTAYVDTDGMDIFVDGHLVEQPDATIPPDGSQIVCTPHIAGKGLKRILGFAAMIALTVYAGNVGGGLWAKAGSFFAKGAIGATLASGAVMLLGGKLINAIFPQDISTPKWNDQESSQAYGWDLPTPSTLAGNCVGETYGECIPAAQLLEQHVETVNNKQYLNLLYCGGYGPVDSIDKIRIDYTDIGNFTGVQLETRLGTNDQKPISFFHTTPLDQSVGLELDVNAPLVRTSDSALASSFEVTLEWPAGLYHINDDSNFGNATTKFRIEYRKSGADTWTLDKEYTETAATNEALRKSYQINGLEEGRYDVRVTLLSKPSSSRDQAMVQWTLLTSYNNGVYARPGKVLVAMRILATNQLSGGVPSVSWRQKRSNVWVYNPNESAYEQQPANNPIWAAYDIMHQCRYFKNINTGEMEFVHYGCSHENLDPYYEQWKDAADYAFEMITNENGEKEHRYEFDAFFDTAQKRITAAQKAAAVGHAVIIAHGRNYGIVVDRPGHISQIFGEGRTTVSSVKGSFTSKEDRARAVDVTYNDEHNDFKNTMMTVRSPLYNKDTGVDNTTQLTLFGVKRRSQAYREAVTALATSERQLQFIELQTDIDGIVAEYGDIVGYNHTVSRIGVASGRLASAMGSKVVLDKSVDLDPAKTYEIYVTLSDDMIVKRSVASVTTATKTTELTVTVPFDDAQMPARFDNYAFGECDKSIKPFRIVSASRDGDMLVSLKLAEYDEAMYATELDYSKYPVIDYSNSLTIATITSLTAKEQTRTIDQTTVPDVAVAWEISSAGSAPSDYVVQIKSRNSSYEERVSTKSTAYTFRSVRAGEDYDITVYCIYDAVTTSHETTSLHVHGTAYTDNNASNLIVMLVGKGFNLSWRGATGTAVAGYNVYRGKYGMTMQQCDKVSAAQTATSCYVPTQDAGQYVFYVESIDRDGNTFGETLTGIGSIAMPGKVTDASAYTIYRQYQDGATGYDIVVSFSLPATAAVADVAVYYKTNHIDMTKLSGPLPEGVPADELGYYADWRYAGKGTSRVTISAAQLGDTYRIKLVAEDVNGFTTPDEDATYIELTVEAKQTVPDTPTGFKKSFALGKGFTFAWDDVTNSDVDYYELRYDQNPGAAYNLLARAQGTSITLESMPSRKATIYLYAHNATKKYSYPASLSYDYPILPAPGGLTIEKGILSANITVPDIPSGADGVCLYIEHQPIDIGKNTHYSYSNAAGIYTVTACYYDIFGEGYQTAEYQAVIEPHIDPKYFGDESLSLEMMDKTIQGAVKDAQQALPNLKETAAELKKSDNEIRGTVQDTQKNLSAQITENADKITSIVTNLSDKDKASAAYSAIAQMVDAIQLRVTADNLKEMGQSGQLMSYINLTPTTVSILSRLLHITADTLIDGNVITNGMIKAGAITADKLAASIIELTNSQGIKGGSVVLDTSGLACTDSNGMTIQFGQDGMTSKDKNGNKFSILAQCMMGVAKNGQYVKFANPWTEIPVVIITPQNVQTNNPDYSTSKVRLHCYAEDISVNGFRVRAYSGIAEGAGSFSQYQECGSMSWTIWRSGSDRNVTLPYGSRSITFTVKMPSNASRVAFHGRFGMNLGYKYSNFVRFPNSESQNISIKCNGKETYNGMFFSNDNNNEIHGPSGVHGTDEYCSYVSKIFTVAQGSDLTCTLTLSPWTEHDGDGSDGLRVWLIIDSLDVYVDGEQILDNDGTGAFFVVNRSNGLYTLQ
ncbi:phage tail protein [uncultured Mitsuokella sp.]|uniref:TipJ family phage tail tip protein n=1 Tax=uncultured Mitsuokella sp. TaxID=453120 RepID=UPI0026704605|nr:phage tail protein [uncultured Mitsuokella sp.]